MNKPAIACLCLLTLLTACTQKDKETPSGLKYTVIAAGDGEVARPKEIIIFDWQLKDSKDSVWKETFSQGIPTPAQIADSSQIQNEDGITQMLRMLSKGDSVSTTMPVQEYFKLGGGMLPPEIDSTLNVSFTIKVRDIVAESEFQAYMEDVMQKREVVVLKKDTKDIGDYLSSNNITATADTSGLQYVIHSTGGGKKPSVDDCVEVKYKGTFLKTGEVFDQSDRVAFELSGVIPGWQLGIPLLGKGDSGTFYIPSKLAYGPRGYPGAIPPDAVLVFNVTLLEVSDEYDGETRSCK